MKIYRTIPDSFSSFANRNYSKANVRIALENIYYRMGYAYFIEKIGCHDFNNLNCEEKIGKYFYLFPEDAILEGSKLLQNYHRLRGSTYLIIEYDVPEEVILKNIGYGDYTSDIMPMYIMETFIEKNDFGNIILSSNQIESDKKNKCLIDALNFFLENLQGIIGSSTDDDVEYYLDYFKSDNLKVLLSNKSELLSQLLESELYSSFIQQECELVSTPFITTRIAPINREFIFKELGDYNKIFEYYQTFGIHCDFSQEQKNLKKELLYCVDKDTADKEYIKKLLKEKKYI